MSIFYMYGYDNAFFDHLTVTTLLLIGSVHKKLLIIMNNILIDFISLFAILSSVLVITSKNPVIAVIFLISLFIFL